MSCFNWSLVWPRDETKRRQQARLNANVIDLHGNVYSSFNQMSLLRRVARQENGKCECSWKSRQMFSLSSFSTYLKGMIWLQRWFSNWCPTMRSVSELPLCDGIPVQVWWWGGVRVRVRAWQNPNPNPDFINMSPTWHHLPFCKSGRSFLTRNTPTLRRHRETGGR